MAVENPYAAPLAAVANPAVVNAAVAVPDDIRRKIRQGWVATLVCAAMTMVVTLIAMSGTRIMDLPARELLDVALILGLVFGIHKNSRSCAVLMFVYFIIARIVIIADTGKASGLPMAFVFGYFFWQGIVGTLACHRLRKRDASLAACQG